MNYTFDGLRKYLVEHCISKKELAEITGLSLSTINRVLNNENIRLQTAFKICDALGISISDALFDGVKA